MTPADPMIGAHIGDYVVEERIGAGGMGIVYRAVQPLIGKQVAIKVLSPHMASHPEAVHRLLAEARIVSTIQHHGIIDIFGFGELPDGRQYMVMEYLQGTPLGTYLEQRKRLEPAEAFSLLDQVLAALGAAHAAGVVHRDLKPNNIFLVQQPDGTSYIKLLDFGIAKAEVPSEDSPHTVTGQLLGTPEYMAPEQVRSKPVSPRTDLYALGIVAFKLLTGQLPFSGDRVQVLMAQAHETPPVPSQLAPGLPPGVDRLILWLMAKDPEERPASTDEVRRAMAELQKSWGESPRYSSALPASSEKTLPLEPTPMPPPPASRRWLWVASASLALVLIGGLVGLLLHRRSPREAPQPAPVAVVDPSAPAPPPPAPVVEVPEQPVQPPKLEPQPEPPSKLKARLPKAKPRPKPGAAQLAQYTRFKRAYEARVRSGEERNAKSERQLESARQLAVQASKTQDRKQAEELIQTAQELLDDWARDYQQ
jgi:serine/threonine protein kinase